MSGLPHGQDSHLASSPHSSARSSTALSQGGDLGGASNHAESSTTGSRRSASSGLHEAHETPESTKDAATDGTIMGDGTKSKGGSWTRRHKPRHSGGFLLDSTTSTGPHAQTSPILPKRTDTEKKGKKKSEISELLVRKIRPIGHRNHGNNSIGSSPLATEVSTGLDGGNKTESETSDRPQTRESLFSKSGSVPKSTVHGPHYSQLPHDRSTAPAIGFDTDPAQIVNLALSLSENRRRTFSSGRVLSGEHGGKRITSGGSEGHTTRQGSLRQALMTQRRVSQNISPISDGPKRSRTTSSRMNGSLMGGNNPIQPSKSMPPDLEIDDEDINFEVSEATFTRVEKAKQHFELFYEHRRLLNHLPPLHTSSNLPTKHLGRVYNPLQYIRNRKLRFREKHPLNAEAEGWDNVEKVRAWVDAVAGDHAEPRNDPNECIRLPQLQDKSPEPRSAEEADAIDSSPSSSLRHRTDPINTKPRRPRLDWVTMPCDLLADASWMEQGLNKTKIEDRDGNKVYPWDTEFKFTGWRTRTPAHVQPPTAAMAEDVSPVVKRRDVPDLPVFRAQSREANSDRGRRKHKLRDSIHRLHDSQSGSRHSKKRWTKALTRSQSTSSDSSVSPNESFRGRSKKPRHSQVDDHGISSAALEKQMLDMLEREAEDTTNGDRPLRSSTVIQGEKRGSATDERRDSKASARSKTKMLNGEMEKHRPDSLQYKRDTHMSSARTSVDYEGPTRTSFDDDATAPNSPTTTNGFHVPSIAINLSPPQSRSPSPSKSHRASLLNPFRPDRSRSKDKHGISAGDFATIGEAARPISRSLNDDADTRNNTAVAHAFHGTSSLPKRDSLTPDESPSDLRRTESALTKSSSKLSAHESHSRFRGMFKGGRIAELVGNEVSRVGDFIWKRDVPPSSRVSSTDVSVASDASESEADLPPQVVKEAPKPAPRRLPNGIDGGSITRQPTRADTSKYYMTNLPTFTSPFKKDQELQEAKTPGASPENDHISRQVQAQRGRGRPDRFDRLSPPKIDIRSPSPESPGTLDLHRSADGRRDSYGFGASLGKERSRSAQDSTIRLNDALNRGDRGNGPPPTGLSSLDASARRTSSAQRHRPTMSEATRDFSLSSRSIRRAEEHGVSKRDIARARALLLSTGVKAREICRRGNTVRDPPPKWLLDSRPHPDGPVPHITRSQEHLWAAKHLMQNLQVTSNNFRNSLSVFSSKTAPSLHERLQRLDDLISDTLTPRVRAAADDAGELGIRLTTSSTLAVKQLNDVIDMAVRRKRRRFRWVRRGGYVLLEWTLVAVLWWVWLIVMVAKVVTGTVRGVFGTIRWLLFL